MTISISPTRTEHVKIRHDDWDLQWEIQFPELITVNGAILKHFSAIEPNWQKDEHGSWWYEWQPDDAYVNEKRPTVYKDESGQPIYALVTGLELRAHIAPVASRVHLTLALRNQSPRTAHIVSCEGGCFRPASTNRAFYGRDYVERSYVRCSGQMVSMADLDRTMPHRCAYWFDPAGYDRPIESKCEDFWGRSKDRIDRPAVVGMVSGDAAKAVVLGYEGSESALGGKSCLHSRPEFGQIPPGQTTIRKGYILFGRDIQVLANEVCELLG